MFWDSLYSALMIMTNWDTDIVILLYLLFMVTPGVLLLLFLHKKHVLGIKYVRKLFMPVFEALAVAFAVLMLFPIILGLGENALWGFPFKVMMMSPGGFALFVGVLIALAYLIDVIPRLRRLQSFKILVLGGFSLIFVQICLSYINPMLEIELSNFIPGFWFTCGTLFIAAVLSKVGHFVFVTFKNVLGNKFDLREELAELLILPLIAALGLLPVFIYGAWMA